MQDKIKFNIFGIYNLKRGEKAFYKVVAKIAGHAIEFNKVQWDKTTQSIWKFADHEDKIVNANQALLQP